MGVTAKKRYEAVNEHLASQGKEPVSEDTIRRAVKLARKSSAVPKNKFSCCLLHVLQLKCWMTGQRADERTPHLLRTEDKTSTSEY